MSKSLVYEKFVLNRLFFNKALQKQYLPSIFTGLFGEKKIKLLIFLMKKVYEQNKEITINNLLVEQAKRDTKNFCLKYMIEPLALDEATDIVYDLGVTADKNDSLFQPVFMELHDHAFCRFTVEAAKSFTSDVAYNNPAAILARARAIEKLHKVLYGSKFKKRKDSIAEAAMYINTKSKFIPLFSAVLNGRIGGWSRQFIGAMLGRSGHTKSTIVTFDSVYQVLNKNLDKVAIIQTEENEGIFWQRIFALTFRIPIKSMRDGIVKISEAQINKIKELFEGRIIVYDEIVKFKDYIDLLNSINDIELIYTDHINAMAYPGNGSALTNMIGGIPNLINHQKLYLNEHKDVALVNLSQVNEKELLKSGNFLKPPPYDSAYCSQVLHQAAREFISLWYPYRDVIQYPEMFTGKRKNIPTDTEVQLSVEKGSFGGMGLLKLEYNPQFATFCDVDESKKQNEIIFPGNDINDLFKNLL